MINTLPSVLVMSLGNFEGKTLPNKLRTLFVTLGLSPYSFCHYSILLHLSLFQFWNNEGCFGYFQSNMLSYIFLEIKFIHKVFLRYMFLKIKFVHKVFSSEDSKFLNLWVQILPFCKFYGWCKIKVCICVANFLLLGRIFSTFFFYLLLIIKYKDCIRPCLDKVLLDWHSFYYETAD